MADIDAVIAYLHTVYDFEKIILMGFSWGSLIGAEYAKRHGETVSHYIGVGQFIHYIDGLHYSCEWLRKVVKDAPADVEKINAFENSIPDPPQMTPAFMNSLQGFSMLGAKYIAKDGRAFPIKSLLTSPFLRFGEKMAIKQCCHMISGTICILICRYCLSAAMRTLCVRMNFWHSISDRSLHRRRKML